MNKTLTASELFRWYAQNVKNVQDVSKNQTVSPTLVENYFNQLENVNYSDSEEDRFILSQIDNKLKPQKISINKIDWTMLYPQGTNFGWTGIHLNEREQRHFSAIEEIFQSSLNEVPQQFEIFEVEKLISTKTAAGIVIEVGPQTAPGMFVVKSPERDSKELLHEFLIGHQVCNQLRKFHLPNFPYFFGIIKCSKAEEISGHLTSWCRLHKTPNVPQIVMENIRSFDVVDKKPIKAITLSSFIENAKIDELETIIIYLIQTINAIFTAWNKFGFSHNDLHTENVLLRLIPKSKNKWMIPIVYELGYLIFRPGNKIATVIDFGKSSIQSDQIQISLPKTTSEDQTDSWGMARPMNDIIHFMAFILKDLSSRDDENRSLVGQRIEKVLEAIYGVFFELLKEETLNQSNLIFVLSDIGTLKEFVQNRGGKEFFFTIPSILNNIVENKSFIQKFIRKVFSLSSLETHFKRHYLKPNQESSFQMIDPNAITSLIVDSAIPQKKQESVKKRKINV